MGQKPKRRRIIDGKGRARSRPLEPPSEEGQKKLASLKSTSKLSGREDFDPLKCLTNDERNQLDVLLTKVFSHIKAIGE